MRRFLLGSACGLAFLAWAGQGSAQTSTAQRSTAQTSAGQTLRIALRQDLDTLDPALATTYVGRIVFAGLCDKLFDINEKLEIVPQLATGYEWADDRTLLLRLRPNVAFHNGEKLDAQAVKFTFERYMTISGSFRRAELSAIDRVEIVDPLTVRVVLRSPSAAFLAQLTDRSGIVLPPRYTEEKGKDFASAPVCSGPFSFVERVAQDHVTLQKFPGYWNAASIHFDRVVYQVLVDSTVRLANLKAGTVDLAENVAPTDAAAVKSDPRLRLVPSDSLGYFGITNNLNNGPRADNPYGKNAMVRQALDLALDRKALVSVVYNDLYPPTVQAVAGSSPFHDAALAVPARDLDKAKALLKQAGVSLPVKLNLLAFNSPDVLQVAEVIQSMAADAGFEVTIQAMEFASSLQASQRGEYQAYLIGWSGRVDIEGNTYAFLRSGQASNASGYSNADVDRLLEQGRSLTDVAQRKAVYDQMWPILRRDLPITYLWIPSNTPAMTAKVRGFRPIADGLIRVQGLELTR